MADVLLAPSPFAIGPFDTAAIQIAQAQAAAAAANTNEVAFLEAIAKFNDDANARALDSTTSPQDPDPFLVKNLFNLDASGNPTLDVSNLAFLTEFGGELTLESEAVLQAQQQEILQRDAAFLEEGENASQPAPLSADATTVDLSADAQGFARANSEGLTQIANILQPVADEPLTPELLLRIQAQLSAGQSPLQLSLNTLAQAMGFIASMQTASQQSVATSVPKVNGQAVAAVSAIGNVSVENGVVR